MRPGAWKKIDGGSLEAVEPRFRGPEIVSPLEGEDSGFPIPTIAEDGDGDNFSPAQGDCDDDDPNAYPGNEELCGDEVDNDCNGLYDDGCDGRVQFGTLRGGGGCTGGANVGNTAFIGLPILPLLLLRRRRQ